MTNTRDFPVHVRNLQTELARRKERNPRYSLRAFAKFLDMHPSALSRILSGKQDLSLESCALVRTDSSDKTEKVYTQTPGLTRSKLDEISRAETEFESRLLKANGQNFGTLIFKIAGEKAFTTVDIADRLTFAAAQALSKHSS